MNLAYIVNTLFTFFYIFILLRVFLTWIPKLDWYSQPLKGLAASTDWYLNLFRRFIPPISGLDFSPVVAILVLPFFQRIILYLIQILGI